MTIKLGRDLFARQTITRKSVPSQPGGCNWCGLTNYHGKLYQFIVEHDDGRDHPMQGRFCSISCCNSYHGH